MATTLPAAALQTGNPCARQTLTIDGNEAIASIAHRTNEVIAIYPITPSSATGEWSDQSSAEGKPNIWGTTPPVVEMQIEGGAAVAFTARWRTVRHGSLSQRSISFPAVFARSHHVRAVSGGVQVPAR